MRPHRERSWLFLGSQGSGLGWPGPGPGRRWLSSLVVRNSAQGQNRTPPTPRPATSFHSGNASWALAVVRPRDSPRVANISPGRLLCLLMPLWAVECRNIGEWGPPLLSTHVQGAISKQPEVSVPRSHGALTFGTVLSGVATATHFCLGGKSEGGAGWWPASPHPSHGKQRCMWP